jgi:hypothetical protein
MPIDTQDSGFGSLDRIACAGIYESVLQRLCEQATYEPYAALLSESDEQIQQCRLEHEQRTAALMRERSGESLIAHSAHLPSGLPPPFEPFPVGGQRCFMVTPDDVIRLATSARRERQ